MLHYSNASSIEKNRRYLVIKGGACLVALASRGRQQRSRSGHQQRRRSRSNEHEGEVGEAGGCRDATNLTTNSDDRSEKDDRGRCR